MSSGIPLRKRLLVRLIITSVLIALCSVAATAWLAVQTTTRAIQEEQGQALADDTDILRQLSGYAATHPSWSGVQDTLRRLSATMGRRIALTTPDRKPIADSAESHTALPPGAAATVDPLHTDTDSEPGAQLSGIDPRAVGPYRLTSKEHARLDVLARKRQACYRRNHFETTLSWMPSGRPLLTDTGKTVKDDQAVSECEDGQVNILMPTEQTAQDELTRIVQECLQRKHVARPSSQAVYLHFSILTPQPQFDLGETAAHGLPTATRTESDECLTDARREQLDPDVAPVAELFLGTGDSAVPHFDMSNTNKAKIVGVAGLVLALTVAMTALVATRLVRPLRALTQAAQQPPEQHVRVPVTTRDETGILALAFNELAERRERMEAQRKAMVSDIAHELRTPLTNIRGWLEVTRDGIVDPDPELLASLHEEAVLLQRVIDDLQDLAAADAGTLTLHREAVRTDELLEQVAAAHRVGAEAVGIKLRRAVDAAPSLAGEGTPWLDADPVRMRQALGNLVSNAIRHTPADGTITLSVRRQDDGQVALEVADTGSGIAEEDLPSVFDRFWRAEKSRSRRTGGSGLGLSIVRQLVAAHGGTVAVTSELGAGTVFTLRLPATNPPVDAEEGR
ncbi:HAMP domain-containing histidine kinase [Streptomyces sp. NBC_00365]|uniref:HAMP domain-containing sensor histidine kinase n=1 Tax=Streptomyces sp. NBC_00365 TaxID=2975726 RepID=UPI0022568DC5|nr:HAMP domain-containing sensor histidine kinase [Streptomyces sp. NBC_00365]MCX5087846.1 HAMP domain-containing histidine kinase [Streptomyces sp. NBC_00365]